MEPNYEYITERRYYLLEDITWMDIHECFKFEEKVGLPRGKGRKDVIAKFLLMN